MNDEELLEIAEVSEAEGNDYLCCVLYTYLGAKAVGMEKLFAEHCADFARSGVKAIECAKNIRNN